MKFSHWSTLAAILSALAPLPLLATPTSGTLYFTTYGGGANVNKTEFNFDGTAFSLGAINNVASTPGADGLVFAPDGDLIVGGQGDRVHKVDRNTGFYTTVTAGGTDSFHVMLDPNGSQVYSAGIPGALATIPLSPFANGTAHTLTGDDTFITTLAFDSVGRAYYTSSDPFGNGNFGTLDLSTYTTTRTMTNVAAAHGMSFDFFTGKLVLFGSSHISQIDLADLTTLYSDFIAPTEQFDQGTVDGKGHVFGASNNDSLLFLDYSASGKVGDIGNFHSLTFLAIDLDDIAPLSGIGSHIPEPSTLLLVPIGIVAIAWRQRKRRSAATEIEPQSQAILAF